MSEVLKGLWITDYAILKSKEFMDYVQPTHILNCAEELSPSYIVPVKTYKIPLIDDEDILALSQICDGVEFLKSCVKEGSIVVVHCKAGISRSATVILAYLITQRGMSFEAVYALLQKARPIIRPNDYYLYLLKELDSIKKQNKNI